MSWSDRLRSLNTVRLRLSLGHALLFVAAAAALLVMETTSLRRQFAEARDDSLLANLREFEALYHEFGLQALAGDMRRAAEARGTENVVMLFRTPSLRLAASSPMGPWGGVDLDTPDLKSLQPGDVQFRTLEVPDLELNLRLAEARLSDGNYLQIGQVERDAPIVRRYRKLFFVVLGAMLGLGVTLGWILVGRAMAGVQEVTRTAAGIGQNDLSARVPHLGRGREIDELVDGFNGMLDRIERLVGELQGVTDNIAHDLRSPLTRIRGLMETVTVEGESLEAYREARGAVIEECDRLVQMINTMLDIAEANAGLGQGDDQTTDLGELVQDAHELFAPVAEEQGVRFVVRVPAEPFPVGMVRKAAQRVLANLIDNALKYTSAGGSIEISLGQDAESVRLAVQDTGCGIAPDDLGHVFDRFYRGESSRTTPGHGLGLALVQALVEASGGHVSVESQPGTGSRFTVTLPPAASHSAATSRT
jgi:signal transduction histidine kinase